MHGGWGLRRCDRSTATAAAWRPQPMFERGRNPTRNPRRTEQCRVAQEEESWLPCWRLGRCVHHHCATGGRAGFRTVYRVGNQPDKQSQAGDSVAAWLIFTFNPAQCHSQK